MMQMEWNSFFANSCYECGNWGTGYPLKQCNSCRAVSFCENGCEKNQTKHQELCRILTEIRGTSPSIFLLEDQRKNDEKAWITLKTNLMLITQIKLGRRLNKQEEDVLKHPKRCISCLEIDPDKLVDCKVCPSTSFCHKHIQSDEEHSERCKKLLECAASDVFFAPLLKRDLPETSEDGINQRKLPENIKAFINICGPPILPFPYDVQTAANSEIFSRPLTLLYAIERLDITVNDRLIIHIVGANAIELEDPSTFQVVFHYWPNLKELQLLFIGPNLSEKFSMPIEESNYHRRKNKKLLIETIPLFYHDFIENINEYSRADLIIGFNLGIHECFDVGSTNDSWTPSIKIIAQEKAPFIVTAYTQDEAQKDHERIMSCSDRFINIYREKNPFSSLRHYRDFETEGFYYQNQYLSIYKRFGDIQEQTEALKALTLNDESMVDD